MLDQAEIHRLTQGNIYERRIAAESLGSSFSHVPDKETAWQDLHRLTQDEDSDVRRIAAKSLGSSFSHVPDKETAWQDLISLAQDEDSDVRWRAAGSLGSAFSHVPDKETAWQDLISLAQDEDSDVRWRAAGSLGSAFSHVPDKETAWQDLHRLTQDEGNYMRWRAADALGSAFSHVPDKDAAWQDLHRLTQDEDSNVRRRAADALGSAFSHVPDKDAAWQDLHRLTQDEDSYMRRRAAKALGSAFSHVPDKDAAWQDLHRLTQDEDSYVRMYVYHSLGRVSVFKATESNDSGTIKHELEEAVAYFEKSSQELDYSPARFCFPFYRTYLAITFQEAKEDEVQRYLAEAKKAVVGSESKDELLKAVENLAQALQEAQRLKNRSVQEVASELNAYKWYCDKAADYMTAAEDKAPGAVKLMRKCNPLLEEQIQATISEIQERARQICQITRKSDTAFEAPGADINRAAKALSHDNIYETQRSVKRITLQLKEFCRLLPKGKRELVCSAVNEIEQANEFPDKIIKIDLALAYVGSAVEIAIQSEDVRSDLRQVHSDVKQVLAEVGIANKKLDEIKYLVFKQKISSGNAISALTSITTELEKLHQLALQYPHSSLKEREKLLQVLSTDMGERFSELKVLLTGKPSKDGIQMVLDKLEQLKPHETWDSKFWNRADKVAILMTYISFLHEVIAVLRTG